MTLDPLERDRLRRKMALRMGIFVGGANKTVECVGFHQPMAERACELCETVHTDELLVLRNRSGRRIHVALPCAVEMVRFQVCDIAHLSLWLDRMKAQKTEKLEEEQQVAAARGEQRRQAALRIVVRKKAPEV